MDVTYRRAVIYLSIVISCIEWCKTEAEIINSSQTTSTLSKTRSSEAYHSFPTSQTFSSEPSAATSLSNGPKTSSVIPGTSNTGKNSVSSSTKRTGISKSGLNDSTISLTTLGPTTTEGSTFKSVITMVAAVASGLTFSALVITALCVTIRRRNCESVSLQVEREKGLSMFSSSIPTFTTDLTSSPLIGSREGTRFSSFYSPAPNVGHPRPRPRSSRPNPYALGQGMRAAKPPAAAYRKGPPSPSSSKALQPGEGSGGYVVLRSHKSDKGDILDENGYILPDSQRWGSRRTEVHLDVDEDEYCVPLKSTNDIKMTVTIQEDKNEDEDGYMVPINLQKKHSL